MRALMFELRELVANLFRGSRIKRVHVKIGDITLDLVFHDLWRRQLSQRDFHVLWFGFASPNHRKLYHCAGFAG